MAWCFPDGTIQTTKTLQGPQGPAGPKGDKGAQGIQGIQGIQGPKGDTGVVDGISKAVHGTIEGSNLPNSTGTGFSVDRSTTGTYNSTFSTAFSSSPDCVISPVGHSTNINIQFGYVACEVSTVSAQEATVECRYYQPYADITNHFIDTPFTFICVN